MSITFNDIIEANEYKRMQANEGKTVIVKREGSQYIATIVGKNKIPIVEPEQLKLDEEANEMLEYIKDPALLEDTKTYINIAHGNKANHYAIERMYNRLKNQLDQTIEDLNEKNKEFIEEDGEEDEQTTELLNTTKRIKEESKTAYTINEKIILIDNMISLFHNDNWFLVPSAYPNATRDEEEALGYILNDLGKLT